jgi:alcohol dehydrogenase
MGATRILGVARNRDLLERVRAIDPARIEVLSSGTEPLGDWARRLTDGLGVTPCSIRWGRALAQAMLDAIGALRGAGWSTSAE